MTDGRANSVLLISMVYLGELHSDPDISVLSHQE